MKRKLYKYFPLFVLPTLIAFTVAFLLPFVFGVILSFCSFTTVSDASFVGISNYLDAFSDNDFFSALLFTLKFTAVSLVTVNLIAFILALLLTLPIKGRNLFRTVFFMPNLIGGIVLGYIWQIIINGVLARFGVDITYSADYGFWGLVILTNWQLIGYMMVIYIAGLTNVPKELKEAARVDGANGFKTLTKIIIPTVAPSITICTFLTLTNSFKLFDGNLALTAGAPNRESSMLALDIYNTFYGGVGQEGIGQAKAVVFFLLLSFFTIVQLWLTKKGENEA